MSSDIVIGMAGSGGDGIVSAGESLMTALAHEGYYALMTKSFGPQIRGGESSCRLRIATERVLNPGGMLDLAIALNWDDFLKFKGELQISNDTVVIWDSATGITADQLPVPGIKPAVAMAVPLTELTRSSAGTDKAKNSLVLGLISGWLGVAREAILAGLHKRFAKKGEAILASNERAFTAGLTYATEHPISNDRKLAPAIIGPAGTRKLLTDGNDMTAAAAIFAGCEFFGGYPITPSTEIMQFLGREIWKYGGSVLQAEDEIAGLGAAVGASFAGKKAMSASSGPGVALKTEMLGLASIAELPLVLVNVQRGGPSTGLPTKAEQGDLFQACFSAHGDVLRPVLAPTCVADSFDVTVEAFNIAETYQTPVLVLSDQEIAQRKETVDPIDTKRYEITNRKAPSADELQSGYLRFRLNDSGVSPISHPGMLGGGYLAAGIEHNEHGDPAASGGWHIKMNDKRFRKLDPLKSRTDLLRSYGDPKAKVALVAWGSNAGVCQEAVRMAQAKGLSVKLLVPLLLYPIAENVFARFFENVSAGLVVEQSHQGQFYRILRMYLDLPRGVVAMCRSGAAPFQPGEVLARLEEHARTLSVS
ncbi:MAG TPA: 2-oxoacid:acceptor oxidoreductase subunit alpha [Polyangiales bacterium]